MLFEICTCLPQNTDTVLRFIHADSTLSFSNPALAAAYHSTFPEDRLTLKHQELISLRLPVNDRYITVWFAGFDQNVPAPYDELRKLIARSGTALINSHAEHVFIDSLPSLETLSEEDTLQQIASTLPLCEYVFDRYQSDKKPHSELTVSFNADQDLFPILTEGRSVAKSIMTARDLVNLSAFELTPEALAEHCRSLGKEHGFSVEVLDRKACEELGMGLFLAVAGGSRLEPRFIIMRWNGGSREQAPIALVGKGITYDSGGLAIKSGGMELMRFDMNGAASVIGAMCAIADQKLSCNVVAVTAACENMVDAESYRNGDTLTSMSGKTVFIQNTDAEGRLTMADAITYCVRKEHPSEIIEIAGLTGSVCSFYGKVCAAALTTEQPMFDRLSGLMPITGEKFAQMPVFPEYRQLLCTPFADLNNAPKDGPGGILAGLFLDSFREQVPFLHIDSGAMPFTRTASDCQPEGGTGFGVKTLYYYIRDIAASYSQRSEV